MKPHLLAAIAVVTLMASVAPAPVAADPPECCLPIGFAAITVNIEMDHYDCCCPEYGGACLTVEGEVELEYGMYTSVFDCSSGEPCEGEGAIPCNSGGISGPAATLVGITIESGCEGCNFEAGCTPRPPCGLDPMFYYHCLCDEESCTVELIYTIPCP